VGLWKGIDIGMLCGKIIKETVIIDRLFLWVAFLNHRRGMCLRLPDVTMLEDLFDDFRLVYDRDDFHGAKSGDI